MVSFPLPATSPWRVALTFDIEAENHTAYERKASQFCAENWVMAIGWQYNDGAVMHRYYKTKDDVPKHIMPDLTKVDVVVGHNIKYDMLWVWQDPAFQAFLKRGGECYCTQYAEYMLNGFAPEYHMNAMNDIATKYGGGSKLDAVKEMWEAGFLTSEIPRDLLLEYLVGSPNYNNPFGDIVGDVANTWRIFVGQLARIPQMHHNFMTMLRLRMDGLLATTEMEHNGIYCDKELGGELRGYVNDEVLGLRRELESYLPSNLPDELKFNWGSPQQRSALIFGGTVSYNKWVQHRDEATGQLLYYSKKETWPLIRKVPTNPAYCVVLPSGLHLLPIPQGVDLDALGRQGMIENEGVHYLVQDATKGGKNKGALKTKQVKMDDLTKPNGKQTEHYFTFNGYCKPDKRWETQQTDAFGKPQYGTGEKIIKKLIEQDTVPFVKAFVKYNKALKDMETYYWKIDEKTDKVKGGMLTLVDDNGIIHHSLNHTSTKTGRLSSSKPNMQTMPRGGRTKDGGHKGSRVKQMLKSRWGEQGQVAEIDYSQLEVVNQGLLTGDPQLIADLNNKVDFHIKRLSHKLHRPYDELWTLHHTDGDSYIGDERTKAKVYSFQSQYGAGLPTIAYDTGMALDEVKALAAADAVMYPGVKAFDQQLEYHIESVSQPTTEYLYLGGERMNLREAHWDCFTGTRYSWREQQTPDFIAAKGKVKGFSPTERKNYPMQGFGGEVIEVMLGKVFRYFLANDRFQGNVLLTNTVHDCMWLDGVVGWLEPVAKACATILEAVPQVFGSAYGVQIPVPFPVELEIGSDLYDMSVIHHK